MKQIWARQALTTEGWQDSVLLTVDSSGMILSMKSNVPAAGHTCSVLLPAPANLHSHAFQRVMAGLTESRSTAATDNFWTWRQAMYELLQHLSPCDVEAIAAYAQMEMLEAGFASVAEFHYLHHGPGGQSYEDPGEMSLRIASAACESGIGLTLLPTLYEQGNIGGQPLEGAQLRFGSGSGTFARIIETANGAVSQLPADSCVGVALHSMRTVSLDVLATARDLFPGLVLHIHAAEQEAEVRGVVDHTSKRPVEWLLDNCTVDPGWCLIHCTHMEPGETEKLAESGAVAGVCPITESNLGDGIFDGRNYIGRGGTLGVGTDSNVRISLVGELRTLEYSQRLKHQIRAALALHHVSPGRAVFEAAGKGGALACRRNSGTLRPGALADLVELDGDSIELSGLEGDGILDTWIFASRSNLVRNVWSAGRHVVRDFGHVGRDRIAGKYRSVQNRLRRLIQGG